LPDDEKRFSFARILAESRHGTMSWLDDQGVPEDARSYLRGAAYLSRDAAQKHLRRCAPRPSPRSKRRRRRARPVPSDLPLRAEIRTDQPPRRA
jgi:hypothetical protein